MQLLLHTRYACLAVLILSSLSAQPAFCADNGAGGVHKLGEVKEWSGRPWSNAYRHATQHYEIRTNTSYDVARYIGMLMEAAATTYREVFGYRFGHIPQLPVNAYATQEEYETLAVDGKFPKGMTSGFYSPYGAGAIHIPYIMSHGKIHPSVTLFHEGTHQFVHEVIDFRIPLPYQKHFKDFGKALPSVPIWLNEGLATYMETAQFYGKTLDIGRVNQMRLSYLQRILMSQTNPPLREVLSRRYGQPFSAAHYAMAWGLVYSLRHDWDVARRDGNRKKLVKYIEACQKAFYHSPSWDFKKEFMQNGSPEKDFQIRWNVRLGKKSLDAFQTIIVGSSGNLDAWEAEWKTRVLSLKGHLPYGGTKRGKAALEKGDTRLYR